MSIEKIKTVSDQILNRLPAVRGKSEEATKQALVLPMLDALGYDIWNPSEVCPEYEADFAIKKAGQKEKVDVALLRNDLPRTYIEVKQVDTVLDGHEGQLARYFNATQTVTLGILTNGVEWRFYTDTGNVNVMDMQPFHVARLDAVDQGLEVMARFAKSVFSPEAIRDYATELLYTAKIAAFLRSEIDLRDKDPSDYFVRWILKSEKMYDGLVHQSVIERFKDIVKAGLTRVMREVVRRSIAAMDVEAARESSAGEGSVAHITETVSSGDVSSDGGTQETTKAIITTERELRLFALAKAILEQSPLALLKLFDGVQRKEVDLDLAYKDTTGYFGIYLNKPSWWVIRVVMESRRPWLGFNLPKEQALSLLPEGVSLLDPIAHSEVRVAISQPEDLAIFKTLFLAAAERVIRNRAGS